MKKYCIFCGEKPINKNKEHVIPQWLINMTGDKCRNISLGLIPSDEDISVRKFAFHKFTFPACTDCNEKYGLLEETIKGIVLKILNGESLKPIQISELLDWFDKVRIGLWLGYRYLSKNFVGIDPNFYIKDRIANKDRLLVVY